MPTPGSPATAPRNTPGRRRVGDDGLDARPRRDLGRGQLRRHAPAADDAARAPGHELELVVDLDHLLDERRLGGGTRVGGEQPGGVGEQDEQVGGDQVGDQRGQPVVVPEPDLVVGGGVVLVDHRHDAQLEQPGQGLAGVEVLLAVDEVERRQQDLAHRQGACGRRRRRRRA